MTVLKLRLLGKFHASREDGRDITLPSKKGQALLAYLALNAKQTHSRDKLALLLWSDRPDERARHSLRQSVLTVRKTLGDDLAAALTTENDSLSFDTGSVEIDALTFERLASESGPDALERAAALYQGDLLEDLNVRSEEFDAWVGAARARLRDLAVDVLGRLAALRAEVGETEAAIATAQKLLAMDVAYEPAHRLLMRLYAGSGRRAAALRQYQVCEEVLRRELDAEPEPETVRLYDEVRTQPSEAPAVPEAPSPAVAEPAVVAVPRGPASESESVLAVAGRLASELLSVTRTASTLMAAVRSASRGRLAWAVGGALSVFIVGGGVLIYLLDSSPVQVFNPAREFKMAFPLPEKPSIVVLPFENRSGESEQEDLIDGITEGITNALSIMSDMFVIARSSALRYKDQPFDPPAVAEELGVQYLLLGSVQKAGGQVRVSAQLVDALKGQQLWAAFYDRDAEAQEVFALQDEITQEIATALQVQMTEGEQERISLHHGTQNLEAWMLTGNGLKLLRRLTRVDNTKARGLYRRAVAIDPKYAGAVDGLAWTHFLDARFGWSASPEASLQRAAELAQQTLALDPTRPPTYALLGYLSVMTSDHDKGIGLLKQAVELSPNGADVAALLGLALTYVGDYGTSISELNRAMRLSPYYPSWYRWSLGRAHRLNKQYPEALAWLEPSPPGEGRSLAQHVELVATYAEMHRIFKARAEAGAILQDYPGFSVRTWTRWPPYKDPVTAEREVEALVRGGLPE